jgi:hypothetical protein
MGIENRIKRMEMAPSRQGEGVLTDLHNHISKATSIQDLLQLSTHGILGVTNHAVMRETYNYEEMLQVLNKEAINNSRVNVNEIEPGLAMVQYETPIGEKRQGYILKTTEFFADRSHIVSFGGFEPNCHSDKDQIRRLNEAGATTISAHPYLLNRPKNVMIQPIKNPSEEIEKEIEEVAELTHLVEAFNGQLGMYKHVNDSAEELAKRMGKQAISTTDGHPFQKAEFTNGVYVPIPEQGLTIDNLSKSLRSGDFVRAENQYLPIKKLIPSLVLATGKEGYNRLRRKRN